MLVLAGQRIRTAVGEDAAPVSRHREIVVQKQRYCDLEHVLVGICPLHGVESPQDKTTIVLRVALAWLYLVQARRVVATHVLGSVEW